VGRQPPGHVTEPAELDRSPGSIMGNRTSVDLDDRRAGEKRYHGHCQQLAASRGGAWAEVRSPAVSGLRYFFSLSRATLA
jgi:hypothetical protein